MKWREVELIERPRPQTLGQVRMPSKIRKPMVLCDDTGEPIQTDGISKYIVIHQDGYVFAERDGFKCKEPKQVTKTKREPKVCS